MLRCFLSLQCIELYKVIMKSGGSSRKYPGFLCAKLTLRDSGHFRGRGNMGAISVQAPSGGVGD